MPPTRLASDFVKDKLTAWLSNALKCELFPTKGDSLANVELPPFERVEPLLASRSMGDDTHVIRAITEDGDVYRIKIELESRAGR